MPVERQDTSLRIASRERKEVKNTSQRCRSEMLRQKVQKDGRSLMMKKVLLKKEPETEKPVQRNNLLRTTCKTKDKVCKVIIYSGSTDNLVSTEMVEKLKLEMTAHPTPYKFSWLQKGHQVTVTQQCLVNFKIE
jgi:hypothetical protein